MTSTHTADDYSLFGLPGREEVAIRINEALDEAIRLHDIEYLTQELEHHSAMGANDSEARNFAFRRYHEGHGVDVTGRTYYSPDSYSFV